MSERFSVSGKRLELKAVGPWRLVRRPGGWIVAEGPDGQRTRVMALESGKNFSASVGGRLLFGELQPERRGGSSAGANVDAELSAQFPGKIRKILVQDGQVVRAGEPLILVEAMKMEFSIKAPVAGKVSRVKVKEGQQVAPGDRFVEMEPAKDG